MATWQTFYGQWRHYSQNGTSVTTYTLSNYVTGILQVVLGFVIQYAGSRFWAIVSFVIHQTWLSKTTDSFSRISQVTLRNSVTPSDTAQDFVKLGYKSKKMTATMFKFIALALPAAAIFAGSTVAGIIIPTKIKSESSESIIFGPNCGLFNLSSLETSPALKNSKQEQDTASAAAYAKLCYGVDPKPPLCNRFTRPDIAWKSTSNVPCPFDLKLCKVNASAGYSMDTGYLDSHDLGINAPSQDRISFRKATTCAPLMAKQLAKMVNETDEYGYNHTYVQLYFGQLNDITNYTYSYDLATGGAGSGYNLESYLAFGQYAQNLWSPIPELNLSNADISLVILAQNSVAYIEPVDDPFFAAHVDFNGLYQGRNATYYFADTYFHILACAEQYQYCNPNAYGTDGQPLCTELSSSVVIERQTNMIKLSNFARLTTGLINTLLPLANIFGSIGGRGVAALRASEVTFHQLSEPLPDNQWTIEVNAWFGTALSRLQHGIVEFATGPLDAYILPGSIVNGKTETWNLLCDSILIGNAENQQSFNALGIWLILGLSSFIIVISQLLEPLTNLFQWCFNISVERYKQWEADDKIALLGKNEPYVMEPYSAPDSQANDGGSMPLLDRNDARAGQRSDQCA